MLTLYWFKEKGSDRLPLRSAIVRKIPFSSRLYVKQSRVIIWLRKMVRFLRLFLRNTAYIYYYQNFVRFNSLAKIICIHIFKQILFKYFFSKNEIWNFILELFIFQDMLFYYIVLQLMFIEENSIMKRIYWQEETCFIVFYCLLSSIYNIAIQHFMDTEYHCF